MNALDREIAEYSRSESLDNNIIHENEQNVNTSDENNQRNALPELDAEYLSAVESGDMETAQRMVPVKLEIKKFYGKKNTLYVAIALEGIKIDEIVKQEDALKGGARQYSPSSTISIADFLKAVKDNPLINEFFSKDVAKKLGCFDRAFCIQFKISPGFILEPLIKSSADILLLLSGKTLVITSMPLPVATFISPFFTDITSPQALPSVSASSV